jgi:predicted ABC-type ATPase
VESGGHGIPHETIRRRYLRSRHNFWYNYKEMADGWFLFDNSGKIPQLVAHGLARRVKIIDSQYYHFFLASIGAAEYGSTE